MEQMCWRTEDWEDIPNIKRTYEELISFIAKNRENILRSNFENAIVTLSFVSAGYWYFALNIVQGKISLHCYWPILWGRSIQQGSQGLQGFQLNSTVKLENICGSPTPDGISSGSAKGLGGQKERDYGHPPDLFTLRTK